jgi:ATP-dependent exoDNAse (exonuclease V) beta subunit
LVRERRVLETALASRGGLDAWHRVRFVIEQARAWSDSGGRFLRDYLEWTSRQTALTGRVAEVPVDDPEAGEPGPADQADVGNGAATGGDAAEDAARSGRERSILDDAVRVLTVHGAKGLEFPIALVCGLSSRPAGRQRGVQVSWGADGQIVRLRADLAQAGFDAHKAIDEQMDSHERVRLLYVACTRARDHLLVSLYRTDTGSQTGAHVLASCVTGAEHEAALDHVQETHELAPAPRSEPTPAGPAPTPTVTDLAVWRVERELLLARAREPGAVSATALAAGALASAVPGPDDDDRFEELAGAPAPDDVEPGLAKRPVDLDLPAWRKGRYGTSIGRAVHAVLQVVDLATGEGVEAAARAQAVAEGLDGEHVRIADLARSALGAPCVRAAAATEHWREVYVGVPVGGRVLEGYIDLLYRGRHGLVVVDHKTDRATTDEEVATKLAAYRLQLAAYALAVERATGEPVAEARLVFCRRGEAREEVVADLREAMAEVESLLGVGPAPAGHR